MLGDFLIRVNAYNEIIAHGFGLTKRVGMTKMDHIVATIAPNTNYLKVTCTEKWRDGFQSLENLPSWRIRP